MLTEFSIHYILESCDYGLKYVNCVLLRVHLSGCYISKMTYMREGERSFTDHEFCRAWHVVTYYRLIRFLPGQF